MYYLIALCVILSSCVKQGTQLNDVNVTNDVVTVQIAQPDYTEETMYSFLRCADIVLSQIKKSPNDYLFNLLDENYFNNQDPVFLIQKTKYTKVKAGYTPYWGNKYKNKRSRYLTFGQKSVVKSSDEVYTRVSYDDVLTNYFTGNLFGSGYTPSVDKNREATKYLYKIFIEVFAKEIRKTKIFNEVYTQYEGGNIVFTPLNELYEKYGDYREHKPNLDIHKFASRTKSQSRNSKQPMIDYYLYLKCLNL
jgi:hypothetical protein